MLKTRILEHGLRIRNTLAKLVPHGGGNGDKPASLLLITSDNPICASQIFPYYFFQSALRQQLGAVISEMRIDKLLSAQSLNGLHADFVFFQPWFDIAAADLHRMFETVRAACPNAKFIFLDSYAPVDLRLAESVNDCVDVYVKKHVFRDRSQYGRETFGDTNLVDYYGRLYGLQYNPTTFNIPSGFIDKLVVGPSFLTSNIMLPLFAREQQLKARERGIDVHARLGGKGEDWYGRMRTHSIEAISTIPDIQVVTGTGMSQPEYLRELGHSKLCFSPFGFGEVCWRDYEAVMCGALLLKPDMGHVETAPDIFIPYETYVPIQWDFSDLAEKVSHYLKHADERQRIVDNAYRLLRNYATSNSFVDHVNTVLTMARQSGRATISASTHSKVTTP